MTTTDKTKIAEKVWVLSGPNDHYIFYVGEKDTIHGIIKHYPEVRTKDTKIRCTETHRYFGYEGSGVWDELVKEGYHRSREMEIAYGSLMMFEDLQFEDNNSAVGGQCARMFFPNGYGVSVLSGPYTGRPSGYEIAVLKGVEDDWDICYDTDIASDVIHVGNTHQIDDVMRLVQELNEDV